MPLEHLDMTPKNNMAKDFLLDENSFLEKYKDIRESVAVFYRLNSVIKPLNQILFGAENLLYRNKLSMPIKKPIFILGNFRSGTTFLEQLITKYFDLGHFTYLSQVFPIAPIFPNKLIRYFPKLSRPMFFPHKPNTKMQYNWPFECEAIWQYCRKGMNAETNSHILDANFSDPKFENILMKSINSHLLQQKKTRFINKNPLCTLRIGYLKKIFPDSLFIYIVRNPFSVLQSQIDMQNIVGRTFSGMTHFKRVFSDQFYPPRTFFKTSAYTEIQEAYRHEKKLGIAKSIVDFDQEFDRQVAYAGLSNSVLKIKYEDLIKDVQESLSEICLFLDLEGERKACDAEPGSLINKNLLSHSISLNEKNAKLYEIFEPFIEKYSY